LFGNIVSLISFFNELISHLVTKSFNLWAANKALISSVCFLKSSVSAGTNTGSHHLIKKLFHFFHLTINSFHKKTLKSIKSGKVTQCFWAIDAIVSPFSTK